MRPAVAVRPGVPTRAAMRMPRCPGSLSRRGHELLVTEAALAGRLAGRLAVTPPASRKAVVAGARIVGAQASNGTPACKLLIGSATTENDFRATWAGTGRGRNRTTLGLAAHHGQGMA